MCDPRCFKKNIIQYEVVSIYWYAYKRGHMKHYVVFFVSLLIFFGDWGQSQIWSLSTARADSCGLISDADLRYYCQQECGSISDADLRYFCQGSHGLISNSGFRMYGQKQCTLIADADLRYLCQGNPKMITNPDMRYYGQKQCLTVADSDLRNLCLSGRAYPGSR